MESKTKKMAIIACGALAKELVQLRSQLGNPSAVKLVCLPAHLHNRPSEIPKQVEKKVIACKEEGYSVFAAYADCGTAGKLDEVLERHGVERLPGAHCYQFFAGQDRFKRLSEQQLASFYLTDFMVRHFDRLIMCELGIKKHPELLEMYFGNYKRCVYLSQIKDDLLLDKAKKAAAELGLEFVHQHTDLGELGAILKPQMHKVSCPI